MNEKSKSKTRRIIDIVLNVVLWVFVALCVVVTVIAVSAEKNTKGVPTVGNKCFMNVLTGSMDGKMPDGLPDGKHPGFKSGTMIVCTYIADDSDAIDKLEVGDIITFEWDMDGDTRIMPGEYNTHRIVKISYEEKTGRVKEVITQGDSDKNINTEQVRRDAIIARYDGFKIAGLGKVMSFLSTQLGFGLCVLLPIGLFFLYELAVFILTLVKVRNADKKIITAEDEEMIRRKAVEEYLRQQAEAKAKNDAGDDKDENDK